MKDNKNPSILNKKKYLALLPFTLLGASAFISNSAQAEFHCTTSESDSNYDMTCDANGTDSLEKVDITSNKKNIHFILDNAEETYLQSSENFRPIDIDNKYISNSPDDIGNITVELKNGNITSNAGNREIISIGTWNYSKDPVNRVNINLNIGKGINIQGISNSSVLSYEGIKVYNDSAGNRNDLTFNGNLSIVNSSQFGTSNYGEAKGITNSFDSHPANPENETHTTINEDAQIAVKGIKVATGIELTSSPKENTTSTKIFFTMNGGNLTVIAKEAYGIYSSITDNFGTRFSDNYKINNSFINLDLNKGSVNVRGNNSIVSNDRDRLRQESEERALGVVAKAKNVTINQEAAHSIQVTGNNADALRLAGQNINLNLAGSITSDTNAIYIEEDSRAPIGLTSSTINIKDSATISTGNGSNNNYVLFDSEGTSNTTIGKAKLNGSFYLAGGDDTLTFNGTDVSNVGIINGGTGFDKVIFANYDQESHLDASQLRNLERIDLNGNTLNLSGTELTLAYGTQGSNRGGLFLNNATVRLNSEANNRRSAEENFTLTGDLHNLEGSIIDLRNDTNPDYFNTLTVNGDYYGSGTLVFNSKAGNDGSHSDKIVLNGDVHGSTKLVINNKGGLGDQTADGIKVVEIADASTVDEGKNAFVLAHSVEAGAYEYNELSYTDTNGKKGFYLQSNSTGGKGGSKGNGGTGSNSSSGSVERGDSTIIDKDGRTVHLLRPAAAAYVLNQQINAQALADLNDGLHQRSGEQRAETNYLNPNQSWVRTIGTRTKVDANNLGSTNNHFGLQVGYDFKTTHQDDFRNRAGVFASYSKVNTTLTDSHRKEFYIPGKVDTHLATLALYNTSNFGNGYLDLVGGLHFLHSDYEIFNGGEQNAFGGNLSVEGGYNFALGNHFFVEPQVQLSYQGTRYAGFKDAVTAVKGYTHQSLRPRAGFRLGYHDLAGTNLWLHANLATELLKTAKVTIGSNVESVDRAAKVAYDLGLNGQVALSPTTVLYGSAQYKGAVGQSETLKSGAKVKATKLSGFGAEAGLRFTW